MTGSQDHDNSPTTPEQATTHGIVVGVDGSEQSVSAAKWGAREAELRGEPESLDPELVVQAAMTSFIYDPAGGRDNAAEAEVASCNNLPGVGQ